MLKYFYKRLREFEEDALKYEDEQMMKPNHSSSLMLALGTHERRDHECQEESRVYERILPPMPSINREHNPENSSRDNCMNDL